MLVYVVIVELGGLRLHRASFSSKFDYMLMVFVTAMFACFDSGNNAWFFKIVILYLFTFFLNIPVGYVRECDGVYIRAMVVLISSFLWQRKH